MDFPFGARNASEVLPPLMTSHPIYAIPYVILLGIFALVGTLGNILVIGTNLTLKEKDQMVGDIFIVNLAASDMIVTALINPVAILGTVTPPPPVARLSSVNNYFFLATASLHSDYYNISRSSCSSNCSFFPSFSFCSFIVLVLVLLVRLVLLVLFLVFLVLVLVLVLLVLVLVLLVLVLVLLFLVLFSFLVLFFLFLFFLFFLFLFVFFFFLFLFYFFFSFLFLFFSFLFLFSFCSCFLFFSSCYSSSWQF